MRTNHRCHAAADAPTPSQAPTATDARPYPSPVLFLDVDGVLNVRGAAGAPLGGGGFSVLHGSLLQRLARVIRATDARVVLSSTWRLDAPSRAHLRRRLCVEFFASAPPLQYPQDATPLISTAELLLLIHGSPSTAAAHTMTACETLATQRVLEIFRWIQQNQAPRSPAQSGVSPSSNSSNPVESLGVEEGTKWVALDDLDLLSAATKAASSLLSLWTQDSSERHFVQIDPATGLSVKDCERLVELLGPVSAIGDDKDDDLMPRWSSTARAVQQRVDLLFIVDTRTHVISRTSEAPSAAVVAVVDTSTFQIIVELESLEEARGWVAESDGVVLFDDSPIAILEIVPSELQPQPSIENPDESKPDPLIRLRQRHHYLVQWTKGELQGRDEHQGEASDETLLTSEVTKQICRAARPSQQAPSRPSMTPSLLLAHLLTCFDKLEAQEFDAEVAQARFIQSGFSHPQLILLAANPVLARHLLHLLPLASSQLDPSSSSSITTSNAKRSRYCELLLAICQRFPSVTQSVLRQHLSEYVACDELKSLAALEAVAFAVQHYGSDEAMPCEQLDELICC